MKIAEVLEQLTSVLVGANAPIVAIGSLVAGVAASYRALTGEPGPSLAQLADIIERQVAANEAYGEAEIARLREKLAEGEGPAPE